MKKLFLLKSMLLLCALIVGSGMTWAADVILTPTATSGTSGDYSWSTAKNSGGSEPTYNDTNEDLRIYAKGSITVSTSGDANMTQIVFALSTQGKKRLAPISASVGTVSTQSSGDETVTWTGSAKTVTFTVGDKANYGSDGSSKAGQLCFTTITITPEVLTPSISADNVNIAADVLAGNISYSITNPNGSSLTAARKSGDWLTVGAVDAENKKVAFTATENTGAAREAVVTLTYGTVTKDVTVTQAAAVAKYAVTYNNAPSNGTLSIKRGETTVSSGSEVADGTTLTIVATPTDAHDYKLSKWQYKEDGDADWTDGVGTTFTVNGKSVSFQASFEARIYHNITYSVNGEENAVEYEEGESISFSAPASGIPGGYSFKGWVVAANKIDTPTDTDPSANYETSATCSADITYYAVMAKKGKTEPSLTKLGSSATFTEGDNIVVVAKGTTYAMYQETKNTSYVANYTFENDAATIAADNKKYFTLTANNSEWNLGDNTNGYLYGTSTGNELYVNSNKADWTITWNNTQEAFTISNGRYLSCRTDLSSANANLYRLLSNIGSAISYFDIYKFVASQEVYSGYCTSIPTIAVSVSSAKYATFCDDVDRNFSGKGITVYTAKSDGTKVNLTEVEDGIVPANKGVVLYSASVLSDVAIPASTTDPSDYNDANNELVGINVRTSVAADSGSGKTNYILSNEDAGVGFYKATAGGAYLAAHRAYLSTTNVASAREFLGFDENETTGVEAVKAEQSNGQYFNLNGQRVAQPTKGLYIVNGKKVVIK